MKATNTTDRFTAEERICANCTVSKDGKKAGYSNCVYHTPCLFVPKPSLVYAKAEKIGVDEARARGTEWLMHPNGEAILSLGDAIEWAAYPDDIEVLRGKVWFDEQAKTVGLFAAKWGANIKSNLDAHQIVEDACCELHEDAYENVDDEAIERLQKLLDDWADTVKGTDTYVQDDSIVVIFPYLGPQADAEEETHHG